MPKKPLFVVFPYLGRLSLQTRTKLTKSLKAILNCCKLQIVFQIKGHIPKELTSSVVYKFQCGLCNESYYGECVRPLNVRISKESHDLSQIFESHGHWNLVTLGLCFTLLANVFINSILWFFKLKLMILCQVGTHSRKL